MRTVFFLALLSTAALMGCSSDPPKVDLSSHPGPPGSSLQGDNLKVPSGSALIVDAFPKESDGDAMDTNVDIVAAEPFEVFRATQRNRFVITASGSGHANLRVVVEGQDVRTISADAE